MPARQLRRRRATDFAAWRCLAAAGAPPDASKRVSPKGPKRPEIPTRVQQLALRRGLILLSCGAYGNVVRFLHPLTIPTEQFEAAQEAVRQVVNDVVPAAALAA